MPLIVTSFLRASFLDTPLHPDPVLLQDSHGPGARYTGGTESQDSPHAVPVRKRGPVHQILPHSVPQPASSLPSHPLPARPFLLVVTPKTAAKDEASSSNVIPDDVRAVAQKLADQSIQETEPRPKTAAKDEASSPQVTTDDVRAVAQKLADQPIEETEPGVWAVLTAISKDARLRPQGMNILLSADEHCLGRTVEERFQILAQKISGKHCKIYRDTVLGELNHHEPVPVYLKDTSSNGTFVNWTKLKKNSSPVKLNHGDIISLPLPPHDDESFVFVYREVNATSCVENGAPILKRKSEEDGFGSKRLKGLGVGSPDGPVSLDDVRRLEKSNADLREQLEAHVVTIETLRTKIKTADEIISSQKAMTCELEGQLSEEGNLRREERDKAARDLKSAVQAQEESKKQAESLLRQQKEQKEVVSKFQESEKETRLLVETLRSDLENARDNLVTSEKKVRELEAQLQDEQLVSANNPKKSENLETELTKLKKALENMETELTKLRKEHENEGIEKQWSCIVTGFP